MTLSPDDIDEVVPGSTYPILVTVEVSDDSIVDLDGQIDDPRLRLSFDPHTIVDKPDMLEADYDWVVEDGTDYVFGVDEFFRPRTTHTAIVLVDPSDSSTEIGIEAAVYEEGESIADSDHTLYQVTDGTPEWDDLAESAGRRTRLAELYGDVYDGILQYGDWEERSSRALQNAMTTIAVDKSKTIAKGAVPGGGWLKAGTAAYGLATEGSESTTVGKTMNIVSKLHNDFIDHVHSSRADRAGRSDEFLTRLAELAAEEETAWRQRDRDALRETLVEARAVTFDAQFHSVGDGRYYREYDGESLHSEADAQRYYGDGFVTEDREIVEFFETLYDFAYDEYQHIQDLLTLVTTPNPRVRTERHSSTIAEQLRDVGAGETESVDVTFTVSNGSEAGPSNEAGYLSISHSETLTVEDITVPSHEEFNIEWFAPGDSIINSEGEAVEAVEPLVDISTAYEPGAEHTISVQFSAVDGSSPDDEFWVTYRSALRPFLPDDTLDAEGEQQEFARDPSEEETDARDQQAWPVYTVSSASVSYPPEADFTLSDSQIAVDETVHVDADPTSVDGVVETYSWERASENGPFETVGDGQTASITFDTAGVKRIRLTVEDDSGETDSEVRSVEVESPSSPIAGFETDPAVPEPGETVEFQSTSTADSYSWTIDGTETTGDSASHTFGEAGNYEITHTITHGGTTDSTSVSLIVDSLTDRLSSPRAVMDVPDELEVGEEAVFDATDSYHPTDDVEITDYYWSLGDVNDTGEIVEHAFETMSEFEISLTVVDEDGEVDSTDSTIDVTAPESSPDPGDLPFWFEDGDVNVDVLRENTENALATHPCEYSSYAIQEDLEAGEARSEVRRAVLDGDTKGTVIQGSDYDHRFEGDPENAPRTSWEYYEDETIYEKRTSEGSDPSFTLEYGRYDDIADTAAFDLRYLEDNADVFDFVEPEWDSDLEVYVIDDASFTLPEEDEEYDTDLEKIALHATSGGIITYIAVKLTVDNILIEMEADGQFSTDVEVDRPEWVVAKEFPSFAWTFETEYDSYWLGRMYEFDAATLYTIIEEYDPIEHTEKRYVTAIDRETGTQTWKQEVETAQSVMRRGDLVVVLDADYRVHTFAPEDGAEQWTLATGEDDISDVRSGSHLFISGEEYLYAVSETDGAIHWQTDRSDLTWSNHGWGQLIATPDALYTSTVRSIDPETGDVEWERWPDTDTAVLFDGVLYTLNSFGGTMYALDASTGDTLWGYSSDTEFFTLDHTNDRLILSGFDGDVLALQTRDEGVDWTVDLERELYRQGTTVSDGHVYINDREGGLHSLSVDDGSQEWTVDIGGRVNDIVSVGETLYIASDNEICIVDPASGEVDLRFSHRPGADALEIIGQTIYTANSWSRTTWFSGLESPRLGDDSERSGTATSVISGDITDTEGEPLTDVEIEVINSGTGAIHTRTTSDRDGVYMLEISAESTYEFRVDDARFELFSTAATVGGGETHTLDIELTPAEDDSPSVDAYGNEHGIVDTDGMRDAVSDWRDDEITTDLLREVVEAWRSGEPVD